MLTSQRAASSRQQRERTYSILLRFSKRALRLLYWQTLEKIPCRRCQLLGGTRAFRGLARGPIVGEAQCRDLCGAAAALPFQAGWELHFAPGREETVIKDEG